MFSLNRPKNAGFVTYMIIVCVIVFSIAVLIITNIISGSQKFSEYISTARSSENSLENRSTALIRVTEHILHDGNANDALTCSGWVITEDLSGSILCTGEYAPGYDGLSDVGDNDDGLPTFGNGGANLFNGTQVLFDDDDASRIHTFGIVPPGEKETVFFMNTDAKNRIVLSPKNSNTYRTTPDKVPNFMLSGNFSSTGAKSTLYILDKQSSDISKAERIIGSLSGVIVTASGYLQSDGNLSDLSGTGSPFPIEAQAHDYAWVIENPSSSGSISYTISAIANGQSVYIIPLDISKSPAELFLSDYRYFGDTFVRRDKTSFFTP